MTSNANVWLGPTTQVPVINANGNIFEEVQVATAAQTVFTLASFQYTPGSKSLWVYRKTAADAGVGGEMLRRAVDYTETSSTQVTLATGATVGDVLIFIAFGIAQVVPPVVFNGMPSGGTTGQILTKSSNSDYAAAWTAQSAITTLLDAPRQNLASASTVNLASLAAATRNVQITGALQIDGFQVVNGQVWAVKFAAALTLKNNGNIVTNTGADIAVKAGGSCLVRATADNIVEILCYEDLSSAKLQLIKTQSLAGLHSVTVNGLDGSQYSKYQIVLDQINSTSASDALVLLLSTGSGFLSANYFYQCFRFTSAATGVGGSAVATSSFTLSSGTETIGTPSTSIISFDVEVFGVDATAPERTVKWTAQGLFQSGSYVSLQGGGYVLTNSAPIDGILLSLATGNFGANAKMSMYGYRNS